MRFADVMRRAVFDSVERDYRRLLKTHPDLSKDYVAVPRFKTKSAPFEFIAREPETFRPV
jgi:hypothetical protein